MENELKQVKQNDKPISEYGTEVENLSTKLASAHVSNNTFPSEAAAESIVQPIAVNAFINGLKNPQTAFFLRARNPTTLNAAISDALEVMPVSDENVLWYNHHRGRGNYRNGRNFRSRGRGRYNWNYNRGNSHNNGNNNQNSNNGYYSGHRRGGPQQGPPQGPQQGHHSGNDSQSNRPRRDQRANVVVADPEARPQTRQQTTRESEEVNVVTDFFRN